jgi:hypothetical protein
MAQGANIDNTITAANSILRYQGSEATATKRWAKAWLSREADFFKTLRSKALKAKRRASHLRVNIKGHFKEFKRCKDHCYIWDRDTYNFDETGYLISVVSRSLIIVLISCDAVYVNDPANKELVTLTECISADGYHVPPMIIFKGAYHLRKHFKNDIDGRIL